ncbi:MAG: hypothetical protein J0L73_23540 [Verrucomicrobia bacterium]|nr:hypothetical protein [Verrucomicrobiota bacterium]
MTRVSILDTSDVVLNGVDSSFAFTGPGTVDCVSVTVSGVTYTGSVLVSAATPFQAMKWHPYYQAAFPYGMAFAFFAAMLVAKFRL